MDLSFAGSVMMPMTPFCDLLLVHIDHGYDLRKDSTMHRPTSSRSG